MRILPNLVLIYFLFVAQFVYAEPYWEYGLGVGAIHIEHYPASSQFRDLTLPFPTFQYRGEILRADDREGARAYIFNSDKINIEFSGAFYPAVFSKETDARSGMLDIPWTLALGPQLVVKLTKEFDFKLAIFQGFNTDFKKVELSGQIGELQLTHFMTSSSRESLKLITKTSLSLRIADKKFNSFFYDVPPEYATETRNRYEAQAGVLSTELSMLQIFKGDPASFYFGINYKNYSTSANYESPLRKRSDAWTGLVGFTWILGKSTKEEMPTENRRGIYQKMLQSF